MISVASSIPVRQLSSKLPEQYVSIPTLDKCDYEYRQSSRGFIPVLHSSYLVRCVTRPRAVTQSPPSL